MLALTLQLHSKLLLIPLLLQPNLPLILMLQLLLIRIVHPLLLNIPDRLVLLHALNIHLLVVVLDHHDALLLVVPGSLGLLADHLVLRVAHEEGLREGAVQHHD
jgi:hypothetical protein